MKSFVELRTSAWLALLIMLLTLAFRLPAFGTDYPNALIATNWGGWYYRSDHQTGDLNGLYVRTSTQNGLPVYYGQRAWLQSDSDHVYRLRILVDSVGDPVAFSNGDNVPGDLLALPFDYMYGYYNGIRRLVALGSPVDTNNPARRDWTTEPINPINGAVVDETTDIVIPAPGIDLVFGRTYNSVFSNTNGPLGSKRTHSFNWRVTGSDPMFRVHTGDGSDYGFGYVPNTTGVYRCPLENAWELRKATSGSFILALESGKNLLFDTNGLLTNIQDRLCNEVSLSYSNHPLGMVLARAEHNNGQYLTFAYDTNAHMTAVQTPSTNWYVVMAYDAAGQLTNVFRHGAGWQETMTYEYVTGTTGQLSAIHRLDAAVAHYNYATNTGFAVGMVMDATGYAHIVSTCPTAGTATVIYHRDETNLPYIYEFEPTMRVTKRSGPDTTNNPVERRQYDPRFLDITNLVSDDVVTGEHLERWAHYDTRHNPTNFAIGYNAAPSNLWKFTWHTNLALPTTFIDPDNVRQVFSYTNGLLVSAGVALGVSTARTVYAYSTNGLLQAVTNADGQWVHYTYDNYGFANSATPAEGPAATFENDQFGHLLNVTMPGDGTTRVTRCTADERGLVHDITYPDGLQESFTYDVAGRLTNAIDRLGRATSCTWLPTRKLASVTRSGATVQFQYDNQFNLLKILDPLGRAVERYTLDARDRPVQVVNVASQQMTVAYGLGNLVRAVTRFDGSVISNRYDGDMRLVEQSFPDLTNRFSYTPAGRLSSAYSLQPSGSSMTNYYDLAGRLTGTVASAAGVSAACSWKLSPAGFVTNAISPAGSQSWTHDLAGRITTLTSPTGTWFWTYNTNNSLAETMTCPNGLTASWTYDILDRLTDAVWVNANGDTVRSWHYVYDDGNKVNEIDRENGEITDYDYDNLDRLTSETRSDGTSTWSYDLAGNRVGRTSAAADRSVTITNVLDDSDRLLGWSVLETNVPCMTEVQGVSSEPIGLDNRFGQLWVSNTVAVIPTVAGSNFLATLSMGAGSQQVVAAIRDAAGNVGYATNIFLATVVTNAQYGYDVAGNTTNIGYSGTDYFDTRSLAWDDAYRLTSVATNGETAETYGYNVLGQRAWTANGGVTNWHVYDGPHVVADLDSTGGVVRSYVYGPGIDNILAMTVMTGATSRTYFYITDRLGSVQSLTDESGAISEQYRYDPWGRVMGVSDGDGKPRAKSAVGNRYLWHGREYSWETGFYYFRARWYDPVTGRWLSNDPIGIGGGLNQYVAFGNNPVCFRDPSGRIWVQVAGTLLGAGANYVHNFSAYTHGQISGWQYTQSVLFGAGAGFVSTVVPGAGGILVGGALAGVNDAYNQSLTAQSGINLNQSGHAALIGVGSGVIGYVGQAVFGELGSSIYYDPNGGIGEIAGSAPYNFGDIGGAIGLAGGTLLGDNALFSIFSPNPPKKCP